MISASDPVQGRLFGFENPFRKRFGTAFFASIPRKPGVYFLKDELNEILYVGKAKDLRARLSSYARARPEQVARKVIRMLYLVRKVEWELCPDERQALLRENHLLRTHQPPFNVVNTHPENYYFVGFWRQGRRFSFRLTTRPPEDGLLDGFFGAFKGRSSVRGGYSALLRLLWAVGTNDARFDFPAVLNRVHSPAYEYELPMPVQGDSEEQEVLKWERLIRRFLHGTSRVLLSYLTERLLANEAIPPFSYHRVQEDLEALERFYVFGPHRNRKLKRHYRIASKQLIGQDQIDDLIVGYRLR